MIFRETGIDGVMVVDMEPHADERGMFARSFSAEEFARHGLMTVPIDANVSRNLAAGTLRGMHYQGSPYPDPKLVRCTAGSIYDVAVDLRADSATYRRWFGTTLSAVDGNALHVPAGCAHGFLTLVDGTEVSYLMGERYHADLSFGVRWDDPAFAIDWPTPPTAISERDAAFDFVTADLDTDREANA